MKRFHGIITPAVSPFKDGEINKAAIRELMAHLHDIDVSGVFPMGSNGTSPFISTENHKRILTLFSDFRNPNEYFLPGVGKNTVEDTLELARYSEDLSSDAIVLVTPYYLKVSQDSIYSFFESIVSRTSLPVILYNIPQMTGNTIMPETILRLSRNYSNIAGVKDSSGNLSLFQDYLMKLPGDMDVFQGQDEFLLSSLVVGAAGGVCGSTNFMDTAVRVMKSYKNGNMKEASILQEKLSRVKNYLNGMIFPQVYSYLFHKLVTGSDDTGTTGMLSPLSDAEKEEIYGNVMKMTEIP